MNEGDTKVAKPALVYSSSETEKIQQDGGKARWARLVLLGLQLSQMTWLAHIGLTVESIITNINPRWLSWTSPSGYQSLNK